MNWLIKEQSKKNHTTNPLQHIFLTILSKNHSVKDKNYRMITKYITTHSFIPKSPSFTKQTITILQIDTNAVQALYNRYQLSM